MDKQQKVPWWTLYFQSTVFLAIGAGGYVVHLNAVWHTWIAVSALIWWAFMSVRWVRRNYEVLEDEAERQIANGPSPIAEFETEVGPTPVQIHFRQVMAEYAQRQEFVQDSTAQTTEKP